MKDEGDDRVKGLIGISIVIPIVIVSLGCLQPPPSNNLTESSSDEAVKIIEEVRKSYGSIEEYEAIATLKGTDSFRLLFFKPDELLIIGAYSVEAFNSSIHWVYDRPKDEVRIDFINQTPEPIAFLLRELGGKSYRTEMKGRYNLSGRECYLLEFAKVSGINTGTIGANTTDRQIWLREACLTNESGRWYPLLMKIAFQSGARSDRVSELTIEFLNFSMGDGVSKSIASTSKISLSTTSPATRIYRFKMEENPDLNQLTDDEILDICLSKTGYDPDKLSFKRVYDNTPESRKDGRNGTDGSNGGNRSRYVTIEASYNSNENFRAYCEIEGNDVSVRISKLDYIKFPFEPGDESGRKAIELAKSKVNATPLFAYRIWNPVTREVKEFRVVMKTEVRGYVVRMENWNVTEIREVRLWFLKDLRPFNLSIYNATPLNLSPITLCAVLKYDGNLPRIVYYGGSGPLEISLVDRTRNVYMMAPAIRMMNLEIKVVEPADEFRHCYTFHLFEGNYSAYPSAKIALEDPEDCYKRYDDFRVAELKCYKEIRPYDVHTGHLSFEIEEIVGETGKIPVFGVIARR